MTNVVTFLGLDATKTATIVRVLDITADVLGISKEEIRGRKRDAEIVFARHIFCYLAHLPEYKHSLTEIGKEIGRDHASVLHAERKIEGQCELYRDVAETVQLLKEKLSGYHLDNFDKSNLTSQHIGYYYPQHRKRALKLWSNQHDIVSKIVIN